MNNAAQSLEVLNNKVDLETITNVLGYSLGPGLDSKKKVFDAVIDLKASLFAVQALLIKIDLACLNADVRAISELLSHPIEIKQ
jgi:hypothetical protein